MGGKNKGMENKGSLGLSILATLLVLVKGGSVKLVFLKKIGEGEKRSGGKKGRWAVL